MKNATTIFFSNNSNTRHPNQMKKLKQKTTKSNEGKVSIF